MKAATYFASPAVAPNGPLFRPLLLAFMSESAPDRGGQNGLWITPNSRYSLGRLKNLSPIIGAQ